MAVNRRRGFTLISVMIALVMLALGILALSGTMTHAVSANSGAGFRTVALDIGRQRMEYLRGIPPGTVAALAEPGGTTVNERGQPDGAGKFTRTVIVSPVRTGLISVLIQVDYPHGAAPVELITYFYTG